MSINATNNGTARELIPAGNYIARCYQMIEIGTIDEYVMGKPVRAKKVRIGWELPTETKIFKQENGEQPLVISKEYTLSMNEKANLRKDLKSWRGKDFTDKEAQSFDITKLIGAPCMLNIIHKPNKDNTRTYEQIAGITPMPKGVTAPDQINKTFILSYDSFNLEIFDSLPDFIKDKMKGSLEYKAMKEPHSKELVDANEHLGPEDDLPF